MKPLLNAFTIFSFLAIIFHFKAVAQKDFRDISWGMNIDQVKQIESAPLTNEEKSFSGSRNGEAFYNGIDLIYDNVTISEKPARMYYHFSNRKLDEIRVVFKQTFSYTFDEPMSETIKFFIPLFDNLKRKNFKYIFPLQCGNELFNGPNLSDPRNKTIHSSKNWAISSEMLTLIDQMISDKHYKYCFSVFENERTYCNLFFKTIYDEYQKLSPVVLKLTPNYNVKKSLKSSYF